MFFEFGKCTLALQFPVKKPVGFDEFGGARLRNVCHIFMQMRPLCCGFELCGVVNTVTSLFLILVPNNYRSIEVGWWMSVSTGGTSCASPYFFSPVGFGYQDRCAASRWHTRLIQPSKESRELRPAESRDFRGLEREQVSPGLGSGAWGAGAPLPHACSASDTCRVGSARRGGCVEF